MQSTTARASVLTALAIVAAPLSGAEHAASVEAPPADTQVGVVGSTPVTYAQLPESLQQTLQQNEERYEERRMSLESEFKRAQHSVIETSVEQFLDRKAAELEAHAQNTTVDKLIENISVSPVSDADIQAYYDQHNDKPKPPLTEIRGQISDYLKDQAKQKATRAYYDGLRAKYAARSTLDPLRQKVAATGPARGPADAAVTIVEFSDFQCPFCGRMAPVLKQLLARYPQQLRLVYREFPLSDIHPNALHAALAAVCASEQGKFWELHDALFADQNALGDEAVMKTAERVGIKLQPFASCLLSSKAYDAVRNDIRAGNEAGVTGTPGMFVNGRPYDGFIPLEAIAAVVEDELHRGGAGQPRTGAVSAASVNGSSVAQH